MATYKECKFYLEGGKCSHEDAPNPYHSRCLGKEHCGAWQDDIRHQATTYPEPLHTYETKTGS